MFVHAKRIIAEAYRHHRTVVAFNSLNAETTLAIARAASLAHVPTLFEISEKTIAYLGINAVVALVKSICQTPSIKAPLALHLDHGHSFELCAAGVRAGFSSVMIDASALPFKANVALTKRVVQYAHRRGVWVQGEVGALKPVKQGARLTAASDLMTDPKQAREFVNLTGVDTLGVAVGTLHGPMKMFKRLPKLDFRRLAAINREVRLPLVLHGASGVPAKDLRRASRLGVTIVNIDTEIRLAYLKALRQELRRQPHEYDPRVLLAPVMQAITQVALAKLKALR